MNISEHITSNCRLSRRKNIKYELLKAIIIGHAVQAYLSKLNWLQ